MALTDKLTAIANAIRAKTGGTATMTLAEMPTEIASIQTGITPSGSVTLTSENTYDVTSKASAIVDFSATRAALAEAVTAKGVDTLPTASFDTIATNIGLIEGGGGGGLEKIGTATTNVVSSFGGSYGEIAIPANDGIFLLTNPSVAPDSTNRLPKAMLVVITTSPVATTMICVTFNNGGSSVGPGSNVKQENGYAYLNGVGAARFNTACTYDLYKI